MRIKWTKRAASNLETILASIAHERPSAAQRFLADTLHQIDQLAEFPSLGRTGVVPLTRELVLHENYIAFYRVSGDAIEILRVLHSRRKYP
jgi:plasmid stabilization system protein ParE